MENRVHWSLLLLSNAGNGFVIPIMKKFYSLYTRKWKRLRRMLLYLFSLPCLFLVILMILHPSNSEIPILSTTTEPSCVNLTRNSKMFDNLKVLHESSDTLCSKRATKHGLHQRVIAISAYQSIRDSKVLNEKIWSYTLEYISEAETFYPDWRVRVYYHNLNIPLNEILKIEKRFKNVDFCDVFNIPILGNLATYMSGRIHRFVAIGDRFVDVYISRDVDSPILQREVMSVKEWISSDKLYHIMRDHPYHQNVILGGLWGVKISQNRSAVDQIIQRLFSKSVISCYDPKNGDQDFLEDYVWPQAEKDSIQHDSFNCHKFPLSIPFPEPKVSISHFVGCRRPCRRNQDSPGRCPNRCRARTNKNSILC